MLGGASEVTRRLCIVLDQACDEATKVQLFTTFAAYGVVEVFNVVVNENYNISRVTLQMQRLSAAERLHRDASASGRPWQVSFEPAVGHTGPQLFLSSRKPMDARQVLPAPSDPAASDDQASSLAFTVEEKMVQAPGLWPECGDVSCSLALHERAAATVSLVCAATQVRASCIGSFAALLTFPDAHEANRCLTLQQHALAAEHEMGLLPVGPATGVFGTAVAKLLTRHTWPLAAAVHADKLVRGVVVRVVSNMECIVDCGLFASPASQQSLPVYTRTNHLKVSLGGEVLVELNVERPRESHTTARMTATLRRVLVVPDASRAQPTSARTLASRLLTRLHSRESGEATTVGGVTASLGLTGGVSYTHRICPFPASLALYAELLMRVERIGHDAVFGHVLDAGGQPTWPVVVPATLLPNGEAHGSRDGGAAEWRRFAVVGERMSVVLRYVVAVGDSAATLCCVASKTSDDVARAAMTRRTVDARRHHCDEDARCSASWTAGTRIDVRPAFRLCRGDIGVPPVDEHKGNDGAEYFPADVMQPATEVTPAETHVLLLCPCTTPVTPTIEEATRCAVAGQAGGASDGVGASVRTVVIADIVRDACVGHFAVVLSVGAYAARQAEAVRQKRLVEQAQRLEVKRRLAAVLGEDAVRGLDEDGREAKRPRDTA